jgi:hypothetical protein
LRASRAGTTLFCVGWPDTLALLPIYSIVKVKIVVFSWGHTENIDVSASSRLAPRALQHVL